MTINVGDRLPEGALSEFIETETEGCALGPNTFKVSDLVKGKKIAVFAVPGAIHPDLFGPASAGLHPARRRVQGQGRR